MSRPNERSFTWLRTGREALAAMLVEIEGARKSIALEMYIWQEGDIGDRFRQALADAAARGVRVRVLVDAFGSLELPANYLQPVVDAGGDCRWFNPIELRRLTYRDHRKLLIVDETIAFVGGYNIGRDYNGDGVTEGWHDLGAIIRGELVGELARAFNAMFGAASFVHRRLSRFRRSLQNQRVRTADGEMLLLSPGRGRNPAREALVQDMLESKNIDLTTAYLLLPRRMRRALGVASRNGARIRLLLPGKSDVRLAQYAARGQYSYLLRAGIQVYEYQAAVLHTKRYLLDDVVYVGSANLDLRSLNINYELLVRVEDPVVAAEGRTHFLEDLERSRHITREEWSRRPWWERLAERMAGMILVRMDLRFAMRMMTRARIGHRAMPLAEAPKAERVDA